MGKEPRKGGEHVSIISLWHHKHKATAITATNTLCACAVQATTRAELTQQLQQGMGGYVWEPEDWEWRPTWTPSMRAAAASAGGGQTALAGNSTDLGMQLVPTGDTSSAAVAGARLLAALAAPPPDSTPQQMEQTTHLLAQLTLS